MSRTVPLHFGYPLNNWHGPTCDFQPLQVNRQRKKVTRVGIDDVAARVGGRRVPSHRGMLQDHAVLARIKRQHGDLGVVEEGGARQLADEK